MRYAFLLTVLTFGNGCSYDDDPATLYLERLAGVLDQELPPLVVERSTLRLFPANAALTIPRPARKVGVLDLLDVHRCELGPLVAQRNGGMGRLQGVTQRYLYDSALLVGLGGCQKKSETLMALYEERLEELSASRFNAVFAGSDWHDFSTPAAAGGDPTIDTQGVSRHLAQLSERFAAFDAAIGAVATQEGSYKEDMQLALDRQADLEGHLGALRFSRALGQQRLQWLRQSAVLASATLMLNRARTSNPGCRTGRPTEAGKARRNVFERYYGQGLQPQLALQAQPDRGWLQQMRRLTDALLSGVPDHPQAKLLQEFLVGVVGSQSHQEYGRWRAALEAHTAAWRWQLQACGLLPGTVSPGAPGGH